MRRLVSTTDAEAHPLLSCSVIVPPGDNPGDQKTPRVLLAESPYRMVNQVQDHPCATLLRDCVTCSFADCSPGVATPDTMKRESYFALFEICESESGLENKWFSQFGDMRSRLPYTQVAEMKSDSTPREQT